jgi:hypothetical protein
MYVAYQSQAQYPRQRGPVLSLQSPRAGARSWQPFRFSVRLEKISVVLYICVISIRFRLDT